MEKCEIAPKSANSNHNLPVGTAVSCPRRNKPIHLPGPSTAIEHSREGTKDAKILPIAQPNP